MFGALLGLGASLIGGLISKPKKQPTPPPPAKASPLVLPAPPTLAAPFKGPSISGYIDGVGAAPDPTVIKTVNQYSAIDLKRLVAESEAAGFNPLTVLRAGGAAGYQYTNAPFLATNPEYVDWETRLNGALTQHAQDTQHVRDTYDWYVQGEMDRYNWSNQNLVNAYNTENENARAEYNWQNNVRQVEWENDTANRQWLGGFVSGMGGAVANFAQSYNPTVMAQAEERRQLENALLVSEIQRNQRTGVTRFASPNVVTGGNLSTTWGTGNRNSYGSDGLTDWGYEPQTPTITNPAPSWLRRYQVFGDMENWEQAYGEIASSVLGLGSGAFDLIGTAGYWADHYLGKLGDRNTNAHQYLDSNGRPLGLPATKTPGPAGVSGGGGGGW
ncbi:hypothetical protein V6767_05915 [Martelella sp. FLE1502]